MEKIFQQLVLRQHDIHMEKMILNSYLTLYKNINFPWIIAIIIKDKTITMLEENSIIISLFKPMMLDCIKYWLKLHQRVVVSSNFSFILNICKKVINIFTINNYFKYIRITYLKQK